MSKGKGLLIFIGGFIVLGAAIIALISLFRKDEPFVTEEGKKLLSDDESKSSILEALMANKQSVKVKGELILLR